MVMVAISSSTGTDDLVFGRPPPFVTVLSVATTKFHQSNDSLNPVFVTSTIDELSIARTALAALPGMSDGILRQVS